MIWYDKNKNEEISPTYRATRKLFDCQPSRRVGPIIFIISQEPPHLPLCPSTVGASRIESM